MSQQDNQMMSNQQGLIEDLTVNQERAEEVKGGAETRTSFAYSPGFRGGVYVAAGDVN